jgi:hypothetical protein
MWVSRSFVSVSLMLVTLFCSNQVSYFKPKHISGLGTFQDGGLGEDLRSLALQEVAAMFPLREEPSLVVSLGTGSARLEESPWSTRTRGLLHDGFIPRLVRALKKSVGGTQAHKFRSRQRKGRREQYFRFDVEFNGPEPELDDTTKLEELKDIARAAIASSKELDRLARCIVSELFIFELVDKPQRNSRQYTGNIICRKRAKTSPFQKLLSQMKNNSARFLFQGHALSGSIADDSYFSNDGNFCKRISFEVADTEAPISIQLQQGSLEPSSISGSPYSIQGLVKALQLDSCFGRADHVRKKRTYSIDYTPRKRRRLI